MNWNLRSLLSLFSNDLGIDLGTAITVVYVRGKGIVLSEPSIVAVNRKTGKVGGSADPPGRRPRADGKSFGLSQRLAIHRGPRAGS